METSDSLLNELKRVTDALSARLDEHDDNRKDIQEKLHATCEEMRKEINELEDKINNELETKFKAEDDRLQKVLGELQALTGDINKHREELSLVIQKAKNELLVKQRYELEKSNHFWGSSKRNAYNRWPYQNFDVHVHGNDSDDEEIANLSNSYKLTVKKEIETKWAEITTEIKAVRSSMSGRIFF